MRKFFLTFVVLITISTFAQDLYFYKGVFYGVSEYGDPIVYVDSENTNRIASTDNVADSCCCYQGYDKASNDLSKLYGSCCWMPLTPGKPRCSNGCV